MKNRSLYTRRRIFVYLTLSALLFLSVGILSGFLNASLAMKNVPELTSHEGKEMFRRFDIEAEYLVKQGSYERLTEDYLYHSGSLDAGSVRCPRVSWFHLLLPDALSEQYQKAFVALLGDAACFPVSPDASGGETVQYEDSWGGARTYGGERRHEGTDIMSSTKERGYFAIVSASDGIVEKKGWLKLGGYRLGIRAPGGAYFYYAHLDHYEDGIEEGTEVKAGQVIGYMGDSGYGEEGTRGKFAVHLHFGIYLTLEEEEVSINPYEILRYLERKE